MRKNDASVSPKTREKVYQAAKELGYRVNYLARSLTNKRSDLVGLVAAGFDSPFRTMQIEHLARALLARNFRPILLPTSKEADTSAVIGQLLHYAVSGVIVTSDAPPTEICEQCAAEGVPIVLINKGEDIPFVDRIVSDDRMAGQLAFKSACARRPSWPHRRCPTRRGAVARLFSAAAGNSDRKRG
jgi:DNA-binding LacI/PurR family transcriptional regulator